MKAIFLVFAFLLSHFVLGQGLNQKGISNVNCTDSLLSFENVTVCAEGKTYQFKQIRASFQDSLLFIQGNKPEERNMFPVFQLSVQTRGKSGSYSSKADQAHVYGTFRKGGQEMYNSQSHNGSCEVSIIELTQKKTKGTFSMTAYDHYGSSAMFVTGTFYINFKKE